MAAPENEHIYGIQLRESADDGSDFTNADADYRKLFLGEDGDLHLKDSSGTVTDIESATAHIADTTDAHDASAVSFDATGLDNTSATEVQTALEDFDAAITAAGGGAAALIGLKAYAAGSDTLLHSQANNTLTDVDATNAAVTFTAPASGNVLVRISALALAATSGVITVWGIRESTSTVAEAWIWEGVLNANRLTATFVITGVSGGSHTYKFAHRTNGTGTTQVYTGPANGQVVMEVWAAP